MEIKRNSLKLGDKVWACAYDYNYNRTEKALIQQPVYGEIVKLPNSTYRLGFAIMKKDGTPRTSGIVDLYSRNFAYTEKECVEIYNEKIKERIELLEDEIYKLNKDLI